MVPGPHRPAGPWGLPASRARLRSTRRGPYVAGMVLPTSSHRPTQPRGPWPNPSSVPPVAPPTHPVRVPAPTVARRWAATRRPGELALVSRRDCLRGSRCGRWGMRPRASRHELPVRCRPVRGCRPAGLCRRRLPDGAAPRPAPGRLVRLHLPGGGRHHRVPGCRRVPLLAHRPVVPMAGCLSPPPSPAPVGPCDPGSAGTAASTIPVDVSIAGAAGNGWDPIWASRQAARTDS